MPQSIKSRVIFCFLCVCIFSGAADSISLIVWYGIGAAVVVVVAKGRSEGIFIKDFSMLHGMTLTHDLWFKIDSKKWQEEDSSYLSLPWQRINGEELVKTWMYGMAPTNKDSFTISTTFCSTKLTQNGKVTSKGNEVRDLFVV